jgi:hypothetical protein
MLDEEEYYLSGAKYQDAKRRIYSAMGNTTIQNESSRFVTGALRLALSYIDYRLIRQQQYNQAVKELDEIRGYLTPGAFPSYEQRMSSLLALCGR